MNRLIVILGTLFCVSGYAQTEVSMGITRGKDFGVVYMLPKTEVRLEVKTVKVLYTPGKFSKYADRYLHLTNVSQEPEEYWQFIGVNVNAVGIPDEKRTYFIKMKDKSIAPLVELTTNGIIKSINVPYDRKPKENVSTTIIPKKKKEDPFSFLTEEILITGSSAKMAELVAKEIYNIRESKNALLRGQADNMPQDGAQLKLMIDGLNEQETALLTMFLGTEEREEKIHTFCVVPNGERGDEVIFRFSKKLGIVTADNLAGAPIYMSLKDLKSIMIPPETKRKDADGVAYNVPGRVAIALTKDKEVLFNGEFPATQFGIIEYLTPTLFNGKSTLKIIFNETTGGLIKVDKENTK
ncbi:hypothetical protein EZS27_008981 [termite gut metagenome]|uniref:DUF4831 family protein n=1 Tax=termite gut metagenome TaxID=433724 RepID=A0A5J4SDJ3_9ZZZZ